MDHSERKLCFNIFTVDLVFLYGIMFSTLGLRHARVLSRIYCWAFSMILGVFGEGLAETALVVFRLLYGALQKQWSGRKVITRKPIRLQAVSLQIYLGECTHTRSRVQSCAWSFACLTDALCLTDQEKRETTHSLNPIWIKLILVNPESRKSEPG